MEGGPGMRNGHGWRFLVGGVALLLLSAGCGVAAQGDASGGAGAAAESVTVRLGFFPNITHAPALVGVAEGIFADALGPGVTLEPSTFNAGPAAVEALFSDALDVTYIGPNPAINAFAQSAGEAVRIIAGSTAGGASLVVRPGIAGPEDLRGARLATPQLGNTQDVALRSWLAEQGLSTDLEGGGDVSVLPQENAQTLETFQAGEIDGAWVPEPWATRLVQEAGGQVLIDEAQLWPDGRFVTTHLIVRTAFLEQHPEVVASLLRGHVAAVDAVNDRPDEARAVTNQQIEQLTGKALGEELITAAWANLEFTVDPISASLAQGARDAEAVGLLERVDLAGIYELEPLNTLLAELGRPAVEGL
jgi:NitT/TauT family transport system substrate-binding protein